MEDCQRVFPLSAWLIWRLIRNGPPPESKRTSSNGCSSHAAAYSLSAQRRSTPAQAAALARSGRPAQNLTRRRRRHPCHLLKITTPNYGCASCGTSNKTGCAAAFEAGRVFALAIGGGRTYCACNTLYRFLSAFDLPTACYGSLCAQKIRCRRNDCVDKKRSSGGTMGRDACVSRFVGGVWWRWGRR